MSRVVAIIYIFVGYGSSRNVCVQRLDIRLVVVFPILADVFIPESWTEHALENQLFVTF